MMQQLILDGYNVIHQVPELAGQLDGGPERARKALAGFLLAWKGTSKYRGGICVVFDGKRGRYGAGTVHGGIRCVYTGTEQKADDRIVSMIKKAQVPAKITVISNDNYIANHCRVYGAKIKPVQFLLQGQGSKAKRRRSEKEIDPATAKDINDFLKGEWGL